MKTNRLGELLALAADLGVQMTKATAKSSITRFTFDGACARLRAAARVIEAAGSMGITLDYMTASGRLRWANGDADAAITRLREQNGDSVEAGGELDTDGLVSFAAERGIVFTKDGARQFRRRNGYARARARVEGAGLLRAEARRLGLDLTQQAVFARLTAAGGDAQDAIARLRREAPPRMPVAEIIETAAAYGIDLYQTRVYELRRDRSDAEVLALISGLGRILDEAARFSVTLNTAQVWIRYGQADGDIDAAIGRLAAEGEERVEQQRRMNRPISECVARLAGRDREGQENEMARCHCRRCSRELVIGLRGYTATIVRRWPKLTARMGFDDALQEALETLPEALRCWDQRGKFASFYGAVANNRLLALNDPFIRDKRREIPVSLNMSLGTDDGSAELMDIIAGNGPPVDDLVAMRGQIEDAYEDHYLAATA